MKNVVEIIQETKREKQLEGRIHQRRKLSSVIPGPFRRYSALINVVPSQADPAYSLYKYLAPYSAHLYRRQLWKRRDLRKRNSPYRQLPIYASTRADFRRRLLGSSSLCQSFHTSARHYHGVLSVLGPIAAADLHHTHYQTNNCVRVVQGIHH